MSNTRSIVEYLELTSSDRVLAVLPFFYVYGKSLLNTHIAVGGSVIIENRFLFPQLAVDALERDGATGFAGVPSTFAILLEKTNFAKRGFPALRYVTQAGGAMAPALIRRLIDALPGKRVFVMYGATEAAARLSYVPPEALAGKIGSVGRAIPNVELRLLKEDGAPAATGEVGEIVARGSNVMEGYWNDPEETAQVLDRDGYHTGDLAVADADGFLRIVGRKREMIKSGAHRIAPKEIEETILEHASVLEAAVIGVPDAVLGESIRAFIVAREGLAIDPDGIAAFCRERLASYKVPQRFELRDALPKNAAGKIMKDRLRASLG
jgi:acyl-CoA synthetase (AMP-forming)/AMP-acid ligase II